MPDQPRTENYLDLGTHHFHTDDEDYDDDEDFDDDEEASVTETWILAFRVSPEGQEVIEKQGEINWIWSFFDFQRNYSETPIKAISSNELFHYLLDYCPGKVFVEPEKGAEIIFELTKFFEFAAPELDIENSDDIVNCVKQERLVDDMEEKLADSANFGMAKSNWMEGKRTGFDPDSPEGLHTFIEFYNQHRLEQLAAEEAVKPPEDTPRSFSNIPIRVEKTGRNEPCPCGSGRKYK